MRYDSIPLDSAAMRRTGSGALVVPARVTRVGVFVYREADGTERREARLPEEVFSRDAMASLEAAPLTFEHPARPVSPETWKAVSVGSVDDPEVDGIYVSAEVIVSDAEAIAQVEAKAIRELSCGYDADFDPTPGEYLGEKYDGIQRNIRYNHVALTAKGRAGPEVRLLIDSEEKMDEPQKDAPPPAPAAEGMTLTLEQAMAEIETLRAKLAQYESAAADKAAAAATDKETLQGTVDSLRAELAAMPERIRKDEAVRAKARTMGIKTDGKSTVEIYREALKVRGVEIGRADSSEAYLAGAFMTLTDSPFAPNGREDSAPKASGAVSSARAARAKMVEDSANAWKGGVK